MTMETSQQPGAPAPTTPSFHDLRAHWPSLPRRARLDALRAAADQAAALWKNAYDLSNISLELLVPHFPARPEALLHRRASPISVSCLLDTLAGWHTEARLTLTPGEERFFLRRLLRKESLDAGCLRDAAAGIRDRADARARFRAESLYGSALGGQRTALSRWNQPLRGSWNPDPGITAPDLHAAIERAEADPAVHVVKDGARIRVLRANLFGRDALIKRYDLLPLGDKLKYVFRPSRARRAWAAAQTLVRLGLPTPEPLGCLEVFRAGIPVRSYYICAFLADAAAARTWIEPHFADQPPALRLGFRRQLLRTLLELYHHAVYHADTKTTNMLLSNPADPERRAFFWIDLECVRFGVVPGRHQLVRNLVQLNGSLGLKVADQDRLRFLHDLARWYPWVTGRDVIAKICAWTRRRLDNERRRQCGS